MDSSQETIYIHKRGTTGKSINEYLEIYSACNKLQSHELVSRHEKYTHASDLIDKTMCSLKQQQHEDLLSRLKHWISAPLNSALSSPDLHVSVTSQGSKSLLSQLTQPEWRTISLHSNECPNFKTALKIIVTRFLRIEDTSDLNIDRRLAYDFDILEEYLERAKTPPSRLIVFFEDVESFHPNIINSIINFAHIQAKTLPLHCIFNLYAPPRVFELFLSREALSKMETRLFECELNPEALVERTFGVLAAECNCFLANEIRPLLVQLPPDSIVQKIKYLCLSHFLGNPASLVTRENYKDHVEVIKRLPSFRDLVLESDSLSIMEDSERLNDFILSNFFVEPPEEFHMDSECSYFPELTVGSKETFSNAFDPNYRVALETALSEPSFIAPSAYRGAIPLAVMYQIARESSMYINLYDWYQAFKEHLVRPEDVEDDFWAKQTLAWFIRGVAELKHLSIIRECKRKYECVEKVAWKDV